MMRAMAVFGGCLFLALGLGCTPELTREEGTLRVIAQGLPAGTVGMDLVLTRASEERRLTFAASGDRAEFSIEGLPVGPIRVQAQAIGAMAVSLAVRQAETAIEAGVTVELRFAFGSQDDAGTADASETSVLSGRILHAFRLREDLVSAGQLTGTQGGNGIALQAFLTQAGTQLGAAPAHLVVVEADLRVESATGVGHLGQLYSALSLVVRGLDTTTEVTVAELEVTGAPTSTPLVTTGLELIGLQSELNTGRFELILRGTTPQTGQSDFEVFLESGVILSASL